ncbi:MAG TPA: hypothetical protein PL089_13980 [Ignavibacteria bacterium]|nr:hypothetical protein [Ignavibacteria bacterium]
MNLRQGQGSYFRVSKKFLREKERALHVKQRPVKINLITVRQKKRKMNSADWFMKRRSNIPDRVERDLNNEERDYGFDKRDIKLRNQFRNAAERITDKR